MDGTSSASLRERGNTWYKKANGVACDTEKGKHLGVARDLYREALAAARRPEERAAAHKNLGLTLACLASLTQHVDGRAELHRESVLHKCRAYEIGPKANKSQEWSASVFESIATSIEAYIEDAMSSIAESSSSVGAAVQRLQLLHAVIPQQFYKWSIYATSCFLKGVYEASDDLINPAAGADGKADWRGCMGLIAEANRPLMEGLQLALDHDNATAVEELLGLEDRLYVMNCRCQSAQARVQGDAMLEQTLHRRVERLEKAAAGPAAAAAAAANAAAELGGVLAAIDLYKAATVLARERDLQAEAQALSRLGHLYQVCADILDPTLVPSTSNVPATLCRSADERSRDAFLKVLLLVDAIPHKISLMMEDWYREARDTISAFQNSRAAADQQRQESAKAIYREALQDELRALYAAANKGWVELLTHCYHKHPPVNPANRLSPGTQFTVDNGKELLKKAIVAYHPDKQQASSSALSKWQVLAEEITKQLTKKYECFK